MELAELHALQVKAKREQDASFAEYLRKQAMRSRDADEQIDLHRRADSITGHWPLVPYETTHQTSAAPDRAGSEAAEAPTQ